MRYSSGQRGQTVNLLATPSKVRILVSPPLPANQTMKETCTILVCSCDAYGDLLKPFSKLFLKYWRDCPFEKVLVTQSPLDDNLCFDRVISCGIDTTWCERLVCALKQISTPYVLMLCDDYYLESSVNTSAIAKRLEQIKKLNGVNLRLIPNPKINKASAMPVEGENLFEYKKNIAYSISTLAGFWNREFLINLSKGKSSIWEFERYGSFSCSDESRPILVTPSKEFPFLDVVHKGYWEKYGVELCLSNGIDLDLSSRTLPPFSVKTKEFFKALIFAIFPNTLIVKTQNALSLGAKEKKR